MDLRNVAVDNIYSCISKTEIPVSIIVGSMGVVEDLLADLKRDLSLGSHHAQTIVKEIENEVEFACRQFECFQLEFDSFVKTVHPTDQKCDENKCVTVPHEAKNVIKEILIADHNNMESQEVVKEEWEKKRNDCAIEEDKENRESIAKENKEKIWLFKRHECPESRFKLPEELKRQGNDNWLMIHDKKSLGSNMKLEELRKWLKRMNLPEESRDPLQNLANMDPEYSDDSDSIVTVSHSECSISSEFSMIAPSNKSCRSRSEWLIPNNYCKPDICGYKAGGKRVNMDIEDLDNGPYTLKRQCSNEHGCGNGDSREKWLIKRNSPVTSVYSLSSSCIANEKCKDFANCVCDESCLKMALRENIKPAKDKNKIQPDELAAFRPYRVVSPIIDMLHSSNKNFLKQRWQCSESDKR